MRPNNGESEKRNYVEAREFADPEVRVDTASSYRPTARDITKL